MATYDNKILIGALLLLVAAVSIASSSKTNIIDDEDIESITDKVCKLAKGSQTQISRVSTIYKLVAFFKTLESDHELSACRDKHWEALNQLKQVISQSNDNVCSEHKLTLIERFHHDFISRTWRDKRQQKSDKLIAPKLLTLFFMHYVAKVSSICEKNFIFDNEAPIQMANDPEKLELLDEFLREFSSKLGANSEPKSYDDITLLWNLADKFPLKEKDEQYLASPGNRKRMFLKAHTSKAESIEMFQQECANKLRPVYSVSVLPVLRLADLGYYQNKEQFSHELASRPDLRRLIGVAQVCEAFLAVKVYKDETLQRDQVVFITREEAGPIYDEELMEQQKQPASQLASLEQNSLISLDTIDTVNQEGGQTFVDNIMANVKARERILGRLFSVMVRQLRDKAKELTGKIFLSFKADKGYVKQEVDEVHTDTSELTGDELELRTNGSQVRRKREFWFWIAVVPLVFAEFLGNLLIIWPIEAICWTLNKFFQYTENKEGRNPTVTFKYT